jgi:hypothetical protein
VECMNRTNTATREIRSAGIIETAHGRDRGAVIVCLLCKVFHIRARKLFGKNRGSQ